MFQFPGSAPIARWCTFSTPGCPIRTPADQFLFADPRSFSQLTTSFFASESLGIPHTPFITSFRFTYVLVARWKNLSQDYPLYYYYFFTLLFLQYVNELFAGIFSRVLSFETAIPNARTGTNNAVISQCSISQFPIPLSENFSSWTRYLPLSIFQTLINLVWLTRLDLSSKT